jgi:mannose-6-phosphate isomerase-like protein (cupin superfamily)
MHRNFATPDESTVLDMSRFEVVRLGDLTITRATYAPGWTWRKYSQPTVGGESCQERHRWYVISGRMGMRMDDGTEPAWSPGDVGEVPPGHDAWVIGDEPFVALIFAEPDTAAP